MTIPELKIKLSEVAPAAPTAPAQTAEQPSSEPVATFTPVIETDHAKRGTDLEATVEASRIAEAATIMNEAGYAIESITGVDWMAEKQFEIVYDFTSFATGKRVALRTRIPRDNPVISTIHVIYPGANWHERETHDFFGIKFAGHPQLTPLLLPEDATFHPLRKDYGT